MVRPRHAVILGLLGAILSTVDSPARAYDDAVCCVRVQDCSGGSCSLGYGSGVVIRPDARRWVVLTAAHVVGNSASNAVHVTWNGRWIAGRVIGRVQDDGVADLAAIEVFPRDARQAAILAESSPPGGTRLGLGGYPGAGPERKAGGVARGISGPWLHYTARLGSGASGGPVWDERGHVVAIHWGEAHGGVGTPVETCWRFLRRWGVAPRPIVVNPAPPVIVNPSAPVYVNPAPQAPVIQQPPPATVTPAPPTYTAPATGGIVVQPPGVVVQPPPVTVNPPQVVVNPPQVTVHPPAVSVAPPVVNQPSTPIPPASPPVPPAPAIPPTTDNNPTAPSDPGPIVVTAIAQSDDNTRLVLRVHGAGASRIQIVAQDADGNVERGDRDYAPDEDIPLEFRPRLVPSAQPTLN